MCERKDHPNYYRCDGKTREHYCVNAPGHERYGADPTRERRWFKRPALRSMTSGAIRQDRYMTRKQAAEVDAVRTIRGVAPDVALNPVQQAELWSYRSSGAGLALLALADRFRAVAASEEVPVEVVAARYENETVRPNRQSAGERLASLVVDTSRPDWVNERYLVAMVEPAENGTPSPAYCSIVRDADDREWVLTRSYDGSQPMVWPNDPDGAGLKAGAWEALERVRAVNAEPETYETYLASIDAVDSDVTSPYTQVLSEGERLALHEQMHHV